MDIIGNYCRRIKSWVTTAIATHTSLVSAHHTDHKVASAESAEFKDVNIPAGEAYKQATKIILRIKDLNTFCGEDSGKFTTGNNNTFMGHRAGYGNTTGYSNFFMGSYAGVSNTTGYRNFYMGYHAGYANTTGYQNNFFGYKAGRYETGSNKLFIDNNERANEEDGRVKALIYGIFDAATANQLLRINAKKVEMPQLGNYINDAAAATGGIAVGGLYHNAGNVRVRVA